MKSKPSQSVEPLQAALAQRGFTDKTIKVLMRAREMLVLAIAAATIKLSEEAGLVNQLLASVKQKDLRIRELEEALTLVQQRLARIEAKHRSRYTPEQRYKILLHKETYSLTLEQAAELFLVSAQTLKRWWDESIKQPTRKAVGSLVKARPPLMRYSDVTRELVHLMDQMGFGGCKRIAQSLTRVGIKLSRETVRRYRQQPPPPKAQPQGKTIDKVLTAKSANHIWMMDITQIVGCFRLFTFKLVVLLDVFSRFPLAWKLFLKEPTAEAISQIIECAAKKYGSPKHFVSDQGSQFTAKYFRATLKRLGIKQRFGAIGKSGSIAIIERLWKTLKGMLRLRQWRAWTLGEVISRINRGLVYYAAYKPHQGLEGATPTEIYFGLTPAYTQAKRPLRAYEMKEDSDETLFEIAYLDPEHLLPVLLPSKKAA